MSIGQTTQSLWRRSTPWRYTTIAAGIVTVLAVVSTFKDASTPQPQPQPQPIPVKSGKQQIQINPPTPTPQVVQSGASQNRWVRFMTEVAAANRNQALGPRCAALARAGDILEKGDHVWSTGDPDRDKALQDVAQCRDNVVASDARLEDLRVVAEAYGPDKSVDKAVALADARKALTPFDLNRQLPRTLRAAVREGDEAVALIESSNRRIDALMNAGRTAASNLSPEAVERLAGASLAITGTDKSRMTAAQRVVYERGREAEQQVAASQSRIEDVLSALRRARAGDLAGRQTLIDAAAGLSEFDEVRASPDERAGIEEARSLASQHAMESLVEVARQFDPDSSDPKIFEQLSNLRTIVKTSGSITTPTPEQQEALRKADLAVAMLAESNRRIDRMVETAKQWRQNASPQLADAVKTAYRSVRNPFDQTRLDGEKQDAYERIENAHQVIRAYEVGKLTPENKAEVPIYVSTQMNQPQARDVVEALRSEMVSRGYRIVDSLEAAAIQLELAGLSVEPSSVVIGGKSWGGSVARARGVARWTFNGNVLYQLNGEGREAGRTAEAAERGALQESADELAQNLDARVSGNAGQ